MNTDERQLDQFFIGVSRRANRWLDLFQFLLVPWRFWRLRVRVARPGTRVRLLLQTQ